MKCLISMRLSPAYLWNPIPQDLDHPPLPLPQSSPSEVPYSRLHLVHFVVALWKNMTLQMTKIHSTTHLFTRKQTVFKKEKLTKTNPPYHQVDLSPSHHHLARSSLRDLELMKRKTKVE